MNFVVLWLFAKIFSAKFGSMASVGVAKASNLRKFSLRKSFAKVFAIGYLLSLLGSVAYTK